jgi:integrase
MPVKLTDYSVQHAKAGTHWDSMQTGLGLKVTGTGKRIWLCQLTFPGQRTQSRRRLGLYPAIGLGEARTKAAEWYSLCQQGRDPADVEAERATKQEAERVAAKEAAERANANTFRHVAEAYMAGRTNRRALVDEREIRRTVLAEWGARPVASITPKDVRTYLGALAKRVPAEALNAWGHAVQIFKYAVHHGHLEVSPMASLDKKLTLNGAKRNARDRVLSEDELRALWLAALARGYPEGHAVRWLMLSACRLSEALGMRWQELHPELRRALRDAYPKPGQAKVARGQQIALTDPQRLWSIPADRTGNKAGKPRDVPLTDGMIALLATVPRGAHAPPDELVFSHTGENQLGNLSKMKAWHDAHMRGTLAELAKKRGEPGANLAPFVLHDLRHTIRTALAGLGTDDVTAEMVIGHGKKGIQRVYDHSKRLPEIRAALTAWGAKLLTIVDMPTDHR